LGAAFPGDSKTAHAASPDDTLHTWDADPAQWIESACAAVERNTTTDDWLEAFGDRPYRETCPPH
jgi:hypothetical protein